MQNTLLWWQFVKQPCKQFTGELTLIYSRFGRPQTPDCVKGNGGLRVGPKNAPHSQDQQSILCVARCLNENVVEKSSIWASEICGVFTHTVKIKGASCKVSPQYELRRVERHWKVPTNSVVPVEISHSSDLYCHLWMPLIVFCGYTADKSWSNPFKKLKSVMPHCHYQRSLWPWGKLAVLVLVTSKDHFEIQEANVGKENWSGNGCFRRGLFMFAVMVHLIGMLRVSLKACVIGDEYLWQWYWSCAPALWPARNRHYSKSIWWSIQPLFQKRFYKRCVPLFVAFHVRLSVLPMRWCIGHKCLILGVLRQLSS